MSRVLGRVCTGLKISPREFWVTEWADIADLYRHWRDAPPVDELVAAAVGFKAPKGREADRAERASLDLSAEDIIRGFQTATAVPLRVP